MYFHNPKRISTLLNTCIRFIVPVSLHYQICIFTSLNTCIRFIAHVFFSLSNLCIIGIEFVFFCYRICAFISPNTCIHIIENAYIRHCTRVFSHHRICISVCHYVGVFVYAGAINRTPTAANRLPITWRTIHETPTNIPLGVGADSSRPYSDITQNVYLHY